MEKIRNIEDARKKAAARVAYYVTRVAEWEKVQRVYTKAGANFKVLSKNFINCKFVNEYGNNEIKIYFKDENGAYNSDWIYLDANSYRNTPAADTPEEVERRIDAVVAQYKEFAETAQKGLETLESLIAAVTPHLDALKETIKEAKETDTQYIIGSYIKNTLGIIND